MSFLSTFKKQPDLHDVLTKPDYSYGQRTQDAELSDSVYGTPAADDHDIQAKGIEEKRLVRRLDIFLMTFACLSQVIKYLDQTNISTAYVSGLREDLSLTGNELNYFTTYFQVAYAIFLIPSQWAITRIRPSFWLPGLEIAWGVMTGLIAMCNNAKQIYALRFFLGAFESSAYPGSLFLLMHWYTPLELAKRIGFYHSCQAIGSMMSGALQVAITNTLHGTAGLEGWRWLFVINAIMTVCLGLFGFVMIPDTPTNFNPRAFWFKKEYADLAMIRYERHRRAEPKKMTIQTFKRTFISPIGYIIPALYVATVLATAGSGYFNLWLKSLTNANGDKIWSVSAINAIPIGGNAINVVFVWFWAFMSDWFQTRWLIVVAQAVIGLIPAIIMSIWKVPNSAKYFSYFISFAVLGTAPPIFAWLSDMTPHDAEMRALLLGFAIALYYAISAWSQVLIWPAKEAPHYKAGWKVSIGLWVFVLLMLFTLRYFDVRFIRPQNARIAAEKQQQAREAQQALRLEEADSLGKVDSKEDSSIGEKKVKVVPVLV